MLLSVCQAIFLVSALSLDTFTALVALGTQKISVPLRSVWAISITCSTSLYLAITLGGWIGNWISPQMGAMIGSIILILLGSIRLFDGLVKELLRRCCENKEGMVFQMKNLKIFLQVCVDSTQADFNHSKSLSVWEAVSLAAALSIDGLAAGVGAGMVDVSHGLIFAAAFGINFLASVCGYKLGTHFSRRFQKDIGWSAGMVLIVLGLLRMIGLH